MRKIYLALSTKLFGKIHKLFICAQKSVSSMLEHNGVEHAGYIAFLSLLSFFPFLIFFFAIIGKIGNLAIAEEFVTIFLSHVPENVSDTLKPRIDEIISGPPQSLLTLAILGAIWTASGAVEGIRTTLNVAYNVSSPPVYIIRRLMSIGQFICITFMIITSLAVIILFPVIWQKAITLLHLQDLNVDLGISKIWIYARYLISGSILFISLCTIYYFIPNVKQKISMILPGALVAVILWIISSISFSIYLKNFNQVNLVYGSLAGLIVSLIFFYIMAMILIFGAEFNYHFQHLDDTND